jgi:DNA-binding CsgD family transcriptional regulator/tetratricopeptide (TPR) repeat protein
MSATGVHTAQSVETIADLLARAQDAPAALLVDGEAGIGKTTLLLHTCDKAARRGFHVIRARGSPSEVTYAYAAVADLLTDVDADTLATLPDTQRIALQRVLLQEVPGSDRVTDERTVATALMGVIERISAASPVLLALDDAQWLDASSRAVIGFVARRLTGRVGVILTFRTGDPGTSVSSAWPQFPEPETATRLLMRPLSLGGVHAMLLERLNRALPRPTITRIHEISGGNPFFALELARAASDAGSAGRVLPDSLAALVRRRVGDVGRDTDDVLLTAACSAAPTVELVSEATDMSTARVVDLLESIENSDLVHVEGNRLRFTHPLFATGVYTNASPSRRRAVHRRLAALAERPELRARHLALAATRSDPLTLESLDSAVEATVAQGAPAVAAELVGLAIGLGGDNVWRRIRAGELNFRAGSIDAARNHLHAALDQASTGPSRCMALMLLAAVKGYDEDLGGAIEAMGSALEETGQDPSLELLCSLRLSLALVMADRLDEALERAKQAVKLSERFGAPGLRSQALSVWVAARFVSGQGVDHVALQAALELEDRHDGATTWFRASAVAAMVTAYTGDLGRAETMMRAVQRQMLVGGTEVDIIWATVRLAMITLWLGRYSESAQHAQWAVERAQQMGGRFALITAWKPQAAAAAYTGREADARVAVAAAIDTAIDVGAARLDMDARSSLAFLEVSLGNYSAALEALKPVLDAFNPAITEIEGGRHLPDAIEALTALGRAEDAKPLVDALQRNGRRLDRPWMLAMGARGQGHLRAVRGDLAGAQSAAEEALFHHERLPMPFETARTKLFLGQVQRLRRRRADAAVSLREAMQTFERLGAPLWTVRAQAELDRVGGVRSDDRSLTDVERRIADLASTGMTNKDIAAQQYISVKTVEMVLSRVYRKLGIRSRAALAVALRAE